MRSIAYCYIDPLLESVPDASVWGMEIDRVYQDLGDRQQWDQLLEDSQTIPTDSLVVRCLDELGESVREVGDRLAALETLGISLIVLEDSAEPQNLIGLRSQMVQAFQIMQASQRRRRIQHGHARNRVKALPPPGKAPYGYRRGKDRYILDRSTAPVVKDFFEHFLLYGSLRGSVRHLQKKYNKRISASTGKRWLTSPVYRGDLAYQTGDVVPNTHAPLISRQEAAQVDRLLRRNRQLPSRTASAPRSLAGLVVCGVCRSSLRVARVTAVRQTREYLYLRPTLCPHQPHCRAILYDQVLDQTIQKICEELPQAIATASIPDMTPIQQSLTAQIDAKQAILQQLPALVSSGILDNETADLRAYKLRTETATLQAKLAQLPPANLQAIAQVVSITQFWLDLSEAERRFYFREFLREIQIEREAQLWQVRLKFIF